MQVQLDLDLFTDSNELIVPIRYYIANFLEDKGLGTQTLIVSVDSRDAVYKGSLVRLMNERVAVVDSPATFKQIKQDYAVKSFEASSMHELLSDYLTDLLMDVTNNISLLRLVRKQD